MKKKSHYQKRMEKFLAIGFGYGIFAVISFWTEGTNVEQWIFFSTLAILASLAAAFDALYDSLQERINIQSSWLDMRLIVLENAVQAKSGQSAWQMKAIPTDDPTYYWSHFPEKKEDID